MSKLKETIFIIIVTIVFFISLGQFMDRILK